MENIKRVSVDFSKLAFSNLDAYRDLHKEEGKKLSYSKIANELCEVFAGLSSDVRRLLIKASIEEQKRIEKLQVINNDELYMLKEMKELENIIKFLSSNDDDVWKVLRPMKKIKMYGNLYLLCPEEWKIANPMMAPSSKYATVSKIHNENLEYIVNFHEQNPFNDEKTQHCMDVREIEIIREGIPDLEIDKILQKHIELVRDKNGKAINEKESQNSPTIYTYPIKKHGLSKREYQNIAKIYEEL